jgi:hypothetical protein
MVSNPYTSFIDNFTNTKEFSYLANFFNENECYTFLSENTDEYKTFWEDVRNKCINGYTNSAGQTITGCHFYYLNFCPILGLNEKTGRKSKIFPRFIDLDYEKFWMYEYCRKNQKSFIGVKGRRQGYSYWAASLCSHEFSFYRDSRCIIGAFLSTFSQNTMNMCIDNLNWLNTHTEFRKQRNPDLRDYIQARYQVDIGGLKVWKGYQSRVMSISFKDDATKSVGQSANLLILDESGVFNNISDTYAFTEPIIKDGSTFTGVALLFGSSGNMDLGSKYFYEMMINPTKYNMLEFEDPDNSGKMTGFFSSATKGRLGLCLDPKSKWFKKPMVDEDGNSNQEAAYDDIIFLRTKSKGGLDGKAFHGVVTQFPITLKEAFLRNQNAVFSSPEMLEHLGQLETTSSLRDQVEKGELVLKDGKYEFQPNPDLNYITEFPLKPEDDSRGCIAIWERPEEINGEIPYSLYVAGCDPYDQDKSGVGSLGSFFIYKRFVTIEKTHDIIVAEYTGRPKFADEFYENCRKLCIYYNAKVLYENQLPGFKGYFYNKNSIHYLWEQPNYMIKDMVKDSKVQRGYGVHMTRGNNGNSGIKDQCEIYTRDWLYTERDDTDGKKIFNFHTIKSIALLKELIAYDGETNTDRVIALMLCILQTKELHKIHIDQMVTSTDTWGNDPFLKKHWEKNRIVGNEFKLLTKHNK